ncbi:hypothetical protein EDD16DRAFT_1649776, partial [Pisolithus croceorrhizus]
MPPPFPRPTLIHRLCTLCLFTLPRSSHQVIHRHCAIAILLLYCVNQEIQDSVCNLCSHIPTRCTHRSLLLTSNVCGSITPAMTPLSL